MTTPTTRGPATIVDRLHRWSSGPWASPAAGALALLLSCTALSGVVSGGGWFGYLALVIALVIGAGIALRALRVPATLAGLGQAAILCFLLTAMFTTRGVAGFIPTAAAFDQFQDVLAQAGDQVQTGVPPVPGTSQIVCLLMVAIGLVAIAVDMLTAVTQAPAVAGLALLCVFAVPAALADNLLPWWSFTLGAIGFVLLLAVDGQHRHRSWRNNVGRAAASGGSGAAPMAVGIAAVSVVIGLFVGSTFTVIGTSGKLPFTDSAGANSVGVRLNPFTSLGGQLRRGRPVELFRVRGLDQNIYLKALTLANFNAKTGWSEGTITRRSTIGPNLPLPDGTNVRPPGPVKTVSIEPIGYRDVWLPNYGIPLGFQGVPPNSNYDPAAGVAFTQSRQKLQPYQERMVVPQPTPDELRSAPGAGGSSVDPQYFLSGPVDPQVKDLAIHLTSGQVTDFDRTLALSHYFTDPVNGFNYSLDAGDGSSNDALANFLFKTKKGFCEQYASAMAIMLRAIGIPSRVVLGFTPGSPAGDYRVITTDDAHAWVEAYFPTIGWTTFDPTPLADGRGEQPSYVVNDGTGRPGQPPDGSTNRPSASATPSTTRNSAPTTATVAAAPVGGPGGGSGTGALLGRLLATVLCMAGAGIVTLGVLAARNRRSPLPRRPTTGRLTLRTVAGPGLIAVGVGLAAALTWSSAVQSWLWALATLVLSTTTCLAMPVALRSLQRGQRVRRVTLHAPGAAAAAWAELRAESRDRGATVLPTETVRAAAKRMAREHDLDESGRDGLRAMIGIVEREWYGGRPADAASGAELADAFQVVRDSLRRDAPLGFGARWWPLSVLHPAALPGDTSESLPASV